MMVMAAAEKSQFWRFELEKEMRKQEIIQAW